MYNFSGLTMTRYKTEGHIKYFKFEHSSDYRIRCQNLVDQLRQNLSTQFRHDNNLHFENCVEALLEVIFFNNGSFHGTGGQDSFTSISSSLIYTHFA